MKKIALTCALALAALALFVSPGFSAGSNPKDDVRAAAAAMLDAWKAKDAVGLCKSTYSAKQLAAKQPSLKQCVTANKTAIKSGKLPVVSGYRIVQIELFRKGHDAIVDVVLTLQTGKAPLFIHFVRTDGQYLLAKAF